MSHALIFGASGISGWALAKEALSYPDRSSFAHVTALTNRPLSLQDSCLPRDDRLQLANGINLLETPDKIAEALKAKVPHLDSVSHVFFAAYVDPGEGYDALRDVNTKLLKNAIDGVLLVTRSLKAVILQTGGKGYGVEFPDKVDIRAPLSESLPRIPAPYYDNIFYYTQYDTLSEMAKDATWTFTEVRPDVIIGFVPGTNVMNCAQGLGLYLSLYRAVHGDGASVPFPGSQGAWVCKHTDTFQDILAKFEIHAALNPTACGNGKAFNIADGAVTTWKDKWPGICAHFDLRGEGPDNAISLDQFAKDNVKAWEETVQKHGLKKGVFEAYQWGFLSFIMGDFDFDRQYDLSAARSAGFSETIDTVKGYTTAFDRMRAARIIP